MKEMQFTAMVMMSMLVLTLLANTLLIFSGIYYLVFRFICYGVARAVERWTAGGGHLRIDEAKRQLRQHPDWQLEAIADRCGFSSRSYFQTVFKKHAGLSPTEFIEQGDALKVENV